MHVAHALWAHSSWSALLAQHELVDTYLETRNGHVAAHRVVLAAHSAFFRAKFKESSGWHTASHENAHIVSVRHMERHTIQTIIEALYSKHLAVDHTNALAVYAASCELDLPGITDETAQVCTHTRSHTVVACFALLIAEPN